MNLRKRARIGFVVMFHPFEDGAGDAEKILRDSFEFLKPLGEYIVPIEIPVGSMADARQSGIFFKNRAVDLILIQLATWSDDRLLLEILSYWNVPVINWALRGMSTGSLCGSQQFNMILKELGKESHVIVGRTTSTVERIGEIASRLLRDGRRGGNFPPTEGTTGDMTGTLLERLRHLKVGIIGARTQGMMEVACSEFDVKEVLGPTILSFSNEQVVEAGRQAGEGAFSRAMNQFRKVHASSTIRAGDEALDAAVRYYIGMKEIATTNHLGALTIECYPHHMGLACLGFSMLADEGITCACEGDVHAAILGWIMQELSGHPVNHIDLLDADPGRGTIVGGHCGSCSPYIAGGEKMLVEPVRLAGGGACVQFPAKPGKVVLANLVGRKGTYRACILKGEALPVKLVFPGNPIEILLEKSVENFLSTVTREGLGHHWIVAYGNNYHQDLVETIRRSGIRIVE
ncbi:MAG: hypothetical protein ACTSUE_14935 [Promethearchaeota archaeon]